MSKRHVFRAFLVAGALGATVVSAQGTKPPAGTTAPAAPPAVPPAQPAPGELVKPPASAAKLPSGVVTQKLRAGSGADSPRLQDFVGFRAIARRLDGSVVSDTFPAKELPRIQLGKLNRGWQEGMAGMKIGEQRRFWFPAEMMPIDKVTGKKEPVVFDIELVQIGRSPDAPASLRAPDPRATKAGAGTSILVNRAGKEGQRASRTDGALVNFSLWNPRGELLAGSSLDGRPTLFPIDKVMRSFADCLVGMQIGEQRTCWIPSLHNEGFPGAQTGDLVFDVELLSFLDMSKLTSAVPPPGKPPGKP